MVNVSKKEMEFLVKNGVGFGEHGIVATTSKHSGRNYYLTESKRNITLLEKFRKSRITN